MGWASGGVSRFKLLRWSILGLAVPLVVAASWIANQDIARGLAEQADADLTTFCTRHGMAAGTPEQSACKSELIDLFKQMNQRRSASGML